MRTLHRIEFPVDFPPGMVAAYVHAGPEPILIDAGPFGDAGEAALREGLEVIGLELTDIEHILLTHFHTDHVGQVGRLRDVADPTISLPTSFRRRHRFDQETVRTRARRHLQQTGLSTERLSDALDNIAPPHGRMREQVPPSAVDHWFEPGSPIEIGRLKLEPLHTPGHDETHVSYVIEDDTETVLVAGDMAIQPFRSWIVRTGWVNGLTAAVADFEMTLDRLATLEVDRVYPGHGPVYENLSSTLERDREGLRDRLDGVRAALPAEGTTIGGLADRLARGPDEAERLLPEIAAALFTLEDVEKVVADRTGDVPVYRAIAAESR